MLAFHTFLILNICDSRSSNRLSLKEIKQTLKDADDGKLDCQELQDVCERITTQQLEYLLSYTVIEDWNGCDPRANNKPCVALKCVINRVMTVYSDTKHVELLNAAFPYTGIV